MESGREGGQPIRPQLGLWDAVAIIVGIVIGTTIYKSPQLIMSNVSSPLWGLGAWALGGFLSFLGALCYAELATTYPRSGGDYVYLTRAFGPWAGFLFGWAQLAVILTSSIGSMAFVFGDYAVAVFQPPGTAVSAEGVADVETLKAQAATARELWTALFAAAAIVGLTFLNFLGVVLGKWTQNLLSILKVVGLGAIAYAGFRYGAADVAALGMTPEEAGKGASFGMAMIFVLYAYGGWNDSAFVAAEVRDRRNIVRSLLLGLAIITVVYLAVNVAYLKALGFDGLRKSWTVAADAVGKTPWGKDASLIVSVLVMVSALGAINGLIFTGSRVYSSMGADHSIFAGLGRWSPRFGSPVWALLAQAAIAVGMIGAVGTQQGREAIDWCMTKCKLPPMPWKQYFGGFDTLVSGTAPVFWGFFLLSGLSLFALRQRDPDADRPFKVPFYPEVPLLFIATCSYMLYSAIAYAQYVSLIGVVPLLLGLPLYRLSRRTGAADGLPAKRGVTASR